MFLEKKWGQALIIHQNDVGVVRVYGTGLQSDYDCGPLFLLKVCESYK